MVQNPLKIQEKNSKKIFYGYLTRYQIPFFEAKKFFKFFFAAFGTRDYHRKKNKKNTGSTWYQIRGLPVDRKKNKYKIKN